MNETEQRIELTKSIVLRCSRLVKSMIDCRTSSPDRLNTLLDLAIEAVKSGHIDRMIAVYKFLEDYEESQ